VVISVHSVSLTNDQLLTSMANYTWSRLEVLCAGGDEACNLVGQQVLLSRTKL